MTLVVEPVMSEKRIHLDLDLIRGKDGKTTNVVMVTLGLLAIVTLGVIYFAVNLSPVGWRQERTTDLPMKTESLANYLEDPSTCASDLDKIFDHVSLVPKSGSIYDIKLKDQEGKGLELLDVDLRIFIPKIPKIVKGDELLTKLTLLQRELNRNDTIFRNTEYGDYTINVSNNCLRCGLWEVYVTRNTGDNTGKIFHGWFEFPMPLYQRLFKEVNGFDLAPYETTLQHYQRPDGNTIDFAFLREIKETKEIPVSDINLHHDSRISRMGEQKAKAKLIVNSGLHKYGDIYEKKNQPIKLMQFDEPGIYKKKKLMKFDFSFLARPEKVEFKKAYNKKIDKTFNELEISFPYGNRNVFIKNWPFLINRDGLKLVLGGWNLEDIPLASERPVPASQFARFTFGTGTPDIYVTYEHRLEDLDKSNNVYLFMTDKNNKYVDNHTLGIDQVYITRFPNGELLLYLVSYERIMLVAQWNLKAPGAILVPVAAESAESVDLPNQEMN